ncbi:MAG: bifunctional 4-hydroxy-2-oxoglutarate aldolase/2-dehydro-3-deoxy-phosphogluconate aldolase [Eubacteriales bacterium]|nr:bifunctional 4-hydroxy-2-oxoglutarate aldolase/2-dehydro-3-deoxy-phosphogluconate aldolase [Eubacteriales bacterium]
MDIVKITKEKKLIAIVRGLGADKLLRLAQALLDGGICMIEITFDQKHPDTWTDTARAIRLLAEQYAGRIYPGAGTVMTVEQVKIAHEAGALYIISPNVNEEVIRETKKLGMASYPGALTPTEAAFAGECGADIIKVFPAGVLEPAYIKAIRAPLSHLDFMAVGGVNEQNASDFMNAGAVGLGVGGNLVNKRLIENGEFDKITALAAQLVEAVRAKGTNA